MEWSLKKAEVIMKSLSATASLLILALLLGVNTSASAQNSEGYESLLSIFAEFRDFSQDNYRGDIAGLPDAMQERFGQLKKLQQRLADIKSSDWPVAEQIDYHLVRAEMNGLEFELRVTRPWERNPATYDLTTGGISFGGGEGRRGRRGGGGLPRLPIAEDRIEEFRAQLQSVPGYYKQVQQNLGGGDISKIPGDLVIFALHNLEGSENRFGEFVSQLADQHPELLDDAKKAQAEIDGYVNWIRDNTSKMTASGGVGIVNYNWLLKNVYLFPYTWEEVRTIVELEDNRVITFLKLEQNRNRNLPPLTPVNSRKDYQESVTRSIDDVMTFIEDQEIFTVPDYLTEDAYRSGRDRGANRPWPEKHDYFFNFSHRESIMEETHEMVGHNFDVQRQNNDERPIRGAREHEGPYYMAVARLEGLAFAFEELFMHAGYLDDRSPRARAVTYEQAAFRTVRGLADVYMHSGKWTLAEAMEWAVANAPSGHLLEDSPHLWHEMHTTLVMTGWHSQMIVGKVHFIKLLRDRAQQLGDKFVLKEFMDDFYAAGVIPTSLIRWEMTGYDDEIKKLW